ncbi:MAG: hypothetical protein AAGU11_01590 [Syntrophobacteraceae bacterium]
MSVEERNTGMVVSVRSSVVDAIFPRRFPGLKNVLRTENGNGVVIEVLSHISSEMVRGIGLTSTQGLAIGSTLIDTGNPLTMPVGRELLGRVIAASLTI